MLLFLLIIACFLLVHHVQILMTKAPGSLDRFLAANSSVGRRPWSLRRAISLVTTVPSNLLWNLHSYSSWNRLRCDSFFFILLSESSRRFSLFYYTSQDSSWISQNSERTCRKLSPTHHRKPSYLSWPLGKKAVFLLTVVSNEHSDFGAQITPFASRTFQYTKEQFGQVEDKVCVDFGIQCELRSVC